MQEGQKPVEYTRILGALPACRSDRLIAAISIFVGA
jgi:hypothetical protein